MTTAEEFGAAFCARTKEARVAAGYTQTELATKLSISRNTLAEYEWRSMMPRYLLKEFCLACRVTMDWLLTGQGERRRSLTREEVRATIKLVQ